MNTPLFPIEDLHKVLTAADRRIEQLEQELAEARALCTRIEAENRRLSHDRTATHHSDRIAYGI